MSIKKLTLKQVKTKYKWRYIDVHKCPDWDRNAKGEKLYEVRRSYKDIHENTTRAEDLETDYEYCR